MEPLEEGRKNVRNLNIFESFINFPEHLAFKELRNSFTVDLKKS